MSSGYKFETREELDTAVNLRIDNETSATETYRDLKPATEEDLYFYAKMGASYLCIASRSGIDFSTAIGVATATYVQVLEGKHGGIIEELGDTKLEREKLFKGAEFQIVEEALKFCPDSIPEDVKIKVQELIEDSESDSSHDNKKLKPATEEDLYLYKGMGASYLCIASKAGIEFPKALGVATATYVQVIEGKHGGIVKELGDTKLERDKLFAGAEFQIVTTAIQYCPDSVPKEVKKKVEKILKENK